MPKKPIISIKKDGENYVLYLGKTPALTYKSANLAQAAAVGADAYYCKLVEEKEKKRRELAERREAWDKSIQEQGKSKQTLPRGIKRKGLKYVVSSPRHLGSFNTLEEALQAKDSAPRFRKPKKVVDFESLPSIRLRRL